MTIELFVAEREIREKSVLESRASREDVQRIVRKKSDELRVASCELRRELRVFVKRRVCGVKLSSVRERIVSWS